MSISGTYNWNMDMSQAILMAYQEINVYDKSDTYADIEAGDLIFAKNKLNGMLKLWGADDIKVSKRQRAFLFPQLNDYSYQLGSIAGSDHCSTSYVNTVLTSSASMGASTLNVSSTTGMNVNDSIGIELDTGMRFWATVTAVPNSTSISFTPVLSSSAVTNNTVVTYTSLINRPLDILYGTTLDLKNNNLESTIQAIAHDQYFNMPAKNTTGRPNNFYYDYDLKGAVPYADNLYVFPQPQNVWQIITFVYVDAIQDLNSATDDINLPQEFLYPVVFNLACELAYSYGKFTELEKIQPKADKLYAMVKENSADTTPLIFRISNSGRI